MITIVNAGITDIPIIQSLTYKIWPETYYPIIGEAQVAYMLGLFYSEEALKEQMATGHQFILCHDDNEPVGFASYSPTEPGIYKLNKLYVLPNQQGKGIGKQMITCIIHALQQLQATHLRLNVNIHNTQAIGFYEKNGFYKFKEEDIDIGGGYFMNDFVLELPL
jgi:ribosomal protein S18 acetylase RimI-like enzyme